MMEKNIFSKKMRKDDHMTINDGEKSIQNHRNVEVLYLVKTAELDHMLILNIKVKTMYGESNGTFRLT